MHYHLWDILFGTYFYSCSFSAQLLYMSHHGLEVTHKGLTQEVPGYKNIFLITKKAQYLDSLELRRDASQGVANQWTLRTSWHRALCRVCISDHQSELMAGAVSVR